MASPFSSLLPALPFPSSCSAGPCPGLGPAPVPLAPPPVLRSGWHTAFGEITAASIGLAYFVVVCGFFNMLKTRICRIFPFSRQRQSGFYTRFLNLVLT